MPPRRKNNKKKAIPVADIIKQNQELADARKQQAEEEMVNFDYDDDRFEAASDDEKVEKMQQYALLAAAEHIDTGKEESFKNAINTRESRDMLLRIASIFPWSKAMIILTDSLFMSFVFGELVPGKLSKAQAREAFLKEVIEPQEQEMQDEPVKDEPKMDFPFEVGKYATGEEKRQLEEYKAIFNDEKKYSALSADEKKDLCKKYIVLYKKFDYQYRPDLEKQLTDEMAEAEPMIDRAIDAMIKGGNKGSDVIQDLESVYIVGTAYGKTFFSRTDEEKLEEFDVLMDYRIPEYMRNSEFKKQYVKARAEEKNKAKEKKAPEKKEEEKKAPEKKEEEKKEPEKKEPEKEPEKKPERKSVKQRNSKVATEKVAPWEELEEEAKPRKKTSKDFSLQRTLEETRQLKSLIDEVDFMMFGKGSDEFRKMKDSVKLLDNVANAIARGRDDINLEKYCACQEKAIQAMEAYLEHKHGQFMRDPDRKDDPARKKREQPRIKNTIKALGILRNSFERNKGIFVDDIRDQYRKKINGDLKKTMKTISKASDAGGYVTNVLVAIDQIYKLDRSNLEVKPDESLTAYANRLRSDVPDQKELMDAYLEDPEHYKHANILNEAHRRFKGGVFDGKEYPGNERVDARRLARMVVENDRFFNSEPEPYYNDSLIKSIEGDMQRRTESLVSKEVTKKATKSAAKKTEKPKKVEQNIKK